MFGAFLFRGIGKSGFSRRIWDAESASSNLATPTELILSRGVIGNTSDFGSEESTFEP